MARRQLRFLVAVAAAMLFWLGEAFATVPLAVPGKDTPPKASLHCGYALYHSSFPLGGVIVNAIDKPGPNGNEINNISAVFRTDKLLLGWLYSSFGGNVMFEPIARPGANTIRVAAKIPRTRTFDAAPMLRAAFEASRKWPKGFVEFPPEIASLETASHVGATVVPCFSKVWNGRN